MNNILLFLGIVVVIAFLYHYLPMAEAEESKDDNVLEDDDNDTNEANLAIDDEEYTVGGERVVDDIPQADGEVGEETYYKSEGVGKDDDKSITCADGRKVDCPTDSIGCVNNSFTFCAETEKGAPLPYSDNLDNNEYLCKRDGNVVLCDYDQWEYQARRSSDKKNDENILERGFTLLEDGVGDVVADAESFLGRVF